jgi:glycosyltransferase involved in cell wall biosynthesis
MARLFILAGFAPSLRNFRGPLIEEFLAHGIEVHAAAPALKGSPTHDWLVDRGVVVHDIAIERAGLSIKRDLRTLGLLIALMRRIRPDYFIGYTIKAVIWGLIAARLAHVPHRVALITGLGYAFTGGAKGKRAVIQLLAKRLYAVALRQAHLIFFQNPDDPVEMANYGILPSRVPVKVVNGSGVNLAQFKAVELPVGPPQFLLIARLLGDKGIREYAQAAAALAPQWPGVGFHIVGALDPNPDAIDVAEVKEWISAGHIIWHGALDDVRTALNAAHVYVLPSYREGTPRTVLEAMATGRAIITTDAPGCRETVQQGVNGFLVPVRDSVSLAKAMETFLVNPELIDRMGKESRRIATEKFDVDQVNAVILDAMGL